MSTYTEQAESFLKRNGIKFRATLSDSKVAPWTDADDKKPFNEPRHGHHYRVTLSKRTWVKTSEVVETGAKGHPKNRLTFDFWGSIADAEAGKTDVSAYDVLSCISSDAHCADTFADWCSEFGESPDSIRAKQTFTRCSRFAKRLQAFFTEQELTELQEIQ